MNTIYRIQTVISIIILIQNLSYSQTFDDAFIQYHRNVEDIHVLETEARLSWVNVNTQDTIHWAKENLIVDEMPRFQGCETITDDVAERKVCADQRLLEYIYANLVYPVEALEDRIEGTTVASFYINPDGTLSNAKIKKDVGAYTGGATLDVLDKMNDEIKWIPGKSNGQVVPVLFTIPVRFKLAPQNRIQHPKMYSKYYETNDDWELIYDPEGEATLNEEAEVRILVSDNGKVLNTRIYSPLSQAARKKVNEIVLDLLDNSSWRPGSTHHFENTMEYVFKVRL